MSINTNRVMLDTSYTYVYVYPLRTNYLEPYNDAHVYYGLNTITVYLHSVVNNETSETIAQRIFSVEDNYSALRYARYCVDVLNFGITSDN